GFGAGTEARPSLDWRASERRRDVCRSGVDVTRVASPRLGAARRNSVRSAFLHLQLLDRQLLGRSRRRRWGSLGDGRIAQAFSPPAPALCLSDGRRAGDFGQQPARGRTSFQSAGRVRLLRVVGQGQDPVALEARKSRSPACGGVGGGWGISWLLQLARHRQSYSVSLRALPADTLCVPTRAFLASASPATFPESAVYR